MRNVFDFLEQLDDGRKKGYREAASKYGDNRWWESDDPEVVLKHQIEEPWQFVSFPDYLDMLGEFLERPVCHLDFAFNQEGIREEVRLALRRREIGVGQSEEQRETAHHDYSGRIKRIISEELPEGRTVRIDLPPKSDRDGEGIDVSGYDGWLK